MLAYAMSCVTCEEFWAQGTPLTEPAQSLLFVPRGGRHSLLSQCCSLQAQPWEMAWGS